MVFQYFCILFSGVLFCCCCIRNSVRNRVRVDKNETDHGIAFSKLQEVIETYEKDDDDNEVICPITQDFILEGEIVKKLPCGHKFSKDINKCICEKNCCPVCRENIVKLVK